MRYNSKGVNALKYQELYMDYQRLLDEDLRLCTELAELPAGHLTTKRISGKEYHYLQYSVDGKKKSVYVKAEQLAQTREQLALRAQKASRLTEVRAEQERLESAVRILDGALSRLFFQLKHSAKMDALPLPQRKKALSFASAMTALEGLPARAQTDALLEQWTRGEASFRDYYLSTLRDYRLLEVLS